MEFRMSFGLNSKRKTIIPWKINSQPNLKGVNVDRISYRCINTKFESSIRLVRIQTDVKDKESQQEIDPPSRK